ncbi:HpcH/HpaI aldolase/citrate lyase family protein [Sphingopyxis kveilinensis]|uniref:HpcH/HpaI aldolase/citrate lyase family protein n=1 Tax=Sphingopyxis kveilinensis TaxID=3114367 RepID=UPI0030CD3405
MTNKPERLRRVQLAVPGNSEKFIAKAAASDADHVFLDLEDAVAPSAKVAARSTVAAGLNELDWGTKTRCVRINDLQTPYAYEDIITLMELAGERLDTIMIPKVKTAADVQWVDILLTQIEAKLGLDRRVGLEVLIEEVEGMMNVNQIAASTPRLECLILGGGDYSASQGIDTSVAFQTRDYPGDIWHHARFRLTIAARANKLDAVDGPYANLADFDGYRDECWRAACLGMTGKWAVHPSQIAHAKEIFSPTADEVAYARRLIAAYEDAQRRGEGAVEFEGVMIDVGSVRILNLVLDKARRMGL